MTADSDPGLAGKVAIVAGEPGNVILDVVRAFSANQMPVAVVCADREATAAAASMYDGTDVGIIAVTADPADPEVWERVGPHAEQRLGPIDVVVLAGPPAVRETVIAALLPDMAFRKRGAIIEIAAEASARAVPEGVRHYALAGTAEVAEIAREGSR
jgi:NADP-dependent 3-hydroxy acid dehydrogenase YdfG